MPLGIILSNGTPAGLESHHIALVVDGGYKNVHQFKLVPVATQQMKIKVVPSKSIRSGMKRTTRMKEETLLFGETLNWDAFDARGQRVELVQEYTRAKNLYESRIFDGDTQLLLQGIMSKDRKTLWMCDIWPDIDIPFHLQQTSHPNVTVNAWVTVKILENETLKYELHSFDSTADNFQCFVMKAAWNAGVDCEMNVFFDPMDKKIEPNHEYATTLSDTITGMKGTVISEKIVMAENPKHRDICFHRVVIKENDGFPPIGTSVRFNALKLSFLNIYALKDITEVSDGRSLPVTKSGFIKTTIRYKEDLPGFYWSESMQCYVDDPENFLECWLLSKFVKSTLQVGITATEPSIRGTPRYAIAEITDAKLSKIQELREGGHIKLDKEPGIVIDLNGRIHVTRLPKSNFRVPRGQFYAPGTRVSITASLANHWNIETVEVNGEDPSIQAVVSTNEKSSLETVWLRVPRARGCVEMPFLLMAPHFGLIQTPRNFSIRRFPNQHVISDVWVRMNDCHDGELIKPPTKFKMGADGEVTPCSKPIERMVRTTSANCQDMENVCIDDQALNKAGVPPVRGAVAEDESQNPMERNSNTSVVGMVRDLEANRNWQENASDFISEEIKEHLKGCRSCSHHELLGNCCFYEYLACALRLKPEIAEVISAEMLSMVTLRKSRN